jgi:hypothetical protein
MSAARLRYILAAALHIVPIISGTRTTARGIWTAAMLRPCAMPKRWNIIIKILGRCTAGRDCVDAGQIIINPAPYHVDAARDGGLGYGVLGGFDGPAAGCVVSSLAN